MAPLGWYISLRWTEQVKAFLAAVIGPLKLTATPRLLDSSQNRNRSANPETCLQVPVCARLWEMAAASPVGLGGGVPQGWSAGS